MKKVLSFLMAFSLLFSTVHATETELNNEEVKNEVVTSEVTKEESKTTNEVTKDEAKTTDEVAKEEVKTTNEETTESKEESDYKWAAIQPGSTTTSKGITIDYSYEGYFKENTGSYLLFKLIYTIPEDYEEETLIINPDIFEVIAWGQEETGAPRILPGYTIKVNVKIVNKSKYNYNYDENSFVICPKSADELVEMGYERIDSNKTSFNGEDLTELQKYVRTDNAALKALGLKKKDMSNENIDKALKAKGYNGVEDLAKYYLDFFNDYYGYGKDGKEKVTKLSDFTAKEIAYGIFGGYTTEYKEDNAELIALHFDFLYNYGMGVSLDDEVINDKNQHEYAPGEYMRNESKGDTKIKEKVGKLESETENDINMNFHFSGPLLTNVYQGYRLTGKSHLSYTAAKGNLTVKYVDENGKELSESIFSTGMIGKEYTTEEKEFQYYELLKVEGNRTGLYAEEDTLVVYVYTYVGGTGGDDPDFPVTGIESNSLIEIMTIVSLVALGTTIVLKKKFM